MKSILSAFCVAALVVGVAPAVQANSAQQGGIGSNAEAKAAPKVFTSPQKEGTVATCPVTGEEFAITKDTLHSEYQGKHVYFCCPGCKTSFDKNPGKYTK